MSLKDKKILLGISGGIAAYKTCELVRLLKKSGAEVRVVMTPPAVQFVSPLTLSALSGNEVMINIFPSGSPGNSEKVESKTWHIYTGMWADVFIIAPATANTLAKIAHGISDNFLTTTVLASRCPVMLFPAMDEDMYLNDITRSNISLLREFGYFVFDPEAGELASGLYGTGRMPEPQTIHSYVEQFLKGHNRDLEGKKILVTAGPTFEPLDDVRFIGNYSTGKMGFQLARAASIRGADVTLVSGPTSLKTPRNVRRVDVKTSDQMFKAVSELIKGTDAVIMSAAVADFKPAETVKGKLKKESSAEMTIRTVRTVDILEHIGRNKNGLKLVGFALETEKEEENAKKKLKAKNLDLIVVNNPNTEGAGFGTDTNVVTIIDKDMNSTRLEKMPKFEIANRILDRILK